MRNKLIRYLPYLVFLSLSLLILGPLLSKGYILSLDMIFTPNEQFPGNPWGLTESWTWFSPCLPLYLAIKACNLILPGWVVEKLFLLLIFSLSGIGAYKLFRTNGSAGGYFAGLLYTVNPFTYVRFLAGQWAVLWSYALTPLAILALFKLLKEQNLKNSILVALLITIVGLPHVSGIVLILIIFFVIVFVWSITNVRDRHLLFKTYKYLVLSAVMAVLLNLYWLIPALSDNLSILNQIRDTDLTLFAARPSSGINIVFDIVAMYGFWRVNYVTIFNLINWWGVPLFVIACLVCTGFFHRLYRRSAKQWQVVSFAVIGLIGFWLAVGIQSEITKGTYTWLWDNIFFFKGLRDSQKFVALLCLSYSFLGGLGITLLIKLLQNVTKRFYKLVLYGLVLLCFASPLLYSFPMFGFSGQLKSTDFPEAWYEVEELLNQDQTDCSVLVLPWHMYMDFSWLPNKDTRLANPARQFFTKPVISGDNIELGNLYTQSNNPISKYIEFLLENTDKIQNLGELLTPLNVKYILLFQESDYEKYQFLKQQTDLQVLINKPGLTLYENQNELSRIYAVDDVVQITDFNQYLELSTIQNVMEHVYVFDAIAGNVASSDADSGPVDFVESKKINEIVYQVDGVRNQYMVFTVPQDVSTHSWEFNGEKPASFNLGLMPVFDNISGNGKVVYTRFFTTYLPGYIISFITFAVILLVFNKRNLLILKQRINQKRIK